MESDILFDQVIAIYGSIIEQKHLRVIRKEKTKEFDYRMMILESPTIKIRFILDRGLVNIALATLDAPNDWSRDQWFDLDIFLGYLDNRKVSPLLRVARKVIPGFAKNRNHEQKHNSVVYDMEDHKTSVSRQLNEAKQKLISSYDEIETFFRVPLSTAILKDLERFRVQHNDEILHDLMRKH